MTDKFASILVGLSFITFFYSLFYLAYRLAFGKNFIKRNFTKKQQIAIVVTCFLVVLFCVFIISRNDFVYCWDSAGYWTWSYTHMKNLDLSTYWSLHNLWDSIIQSDYNLILPTIIYIPLKLFGYTFSRYVFVNTIMFILPSFIILLCLCKKLLSTYSTRLKNTKIFILSLIFTLSFLLVIIHPHFQGYVDTALLIPISLLIALALKYDPLSKSKKQIFIDFTIALLACTTFLFRRYAAFFVISFYIILLVISLFKIFRAKSRSTKLKNLKLASLNFFISAFTALAIMLIFFHGLIFRILGENYAELYSAYDDPPPEKLFTLYTHFGLYFLILAILGIINAIKNKKYLKPLGISLISLIITVALFFRVQSMNGHHILTIAPQAFVIILLGFDYIINLKLKHRIAKRAILAGSVFLLILEPVNFYAGDQVFKNFPDLHIFTQRYTYLIRGDMATLYSIKDYLNTTYPNQPKYVLSSGVIFNHDTLNNLDKPYSEAAITNLGFTHDADTRDGFPLDFLNADIIVTTTPTLTHLREGSQLVVTELADLVKDPNSYLGKHYQKLAPEFKIDEDVTVIFYEKISDFTDEDLEQLTEFYDTAYPNHPELFKDRLVEYENAR